MCVDVERGCCVESRLARSKWLCGANSRYVSRDNSMLACGRMCEYRGPHAVVVDLRDEAVIHSFDEADFMTAIR